MRNTIDNITQYPVLNWNLTEERARQMTTTELVGTLKDIRATLDHADAMDRYDGGCRGGYYRDEISVYHKELRRREDGPRDMVSDETSHRLLHLSRSGGHDALADHLRAIAADVRDGASLLLVQDALLKAATHLDGN